MRHLRRTASSVDARWQKKPTAEIRFSGKRRMPGQDDLGNAADWQILEFKGESPSWTTAPIDWPHCCAHG